MARTVASLAIAMAGNRLFATTQASSVPDSYWAIVDVSQQTTPEDKMLEPYPVRITGEAGRHPHYAPLDGERIRWSQVTEWTWEGPPKSLKAGEPLTMRLTRERFVFTGGNPGYGKFSVDISFVDSEFGTRALGRFFVARKQYDLKLDSVGKSSVDFTGKVPPRDAMKARRRRALRDGRGGRVSRRGGAGGPGTGLAGRGAAGTKRRVAGAAWCARGRSDRDAGAVRRRGPTVRGLRAVPPLAPFA